VAADVKRLAGSNGDTGSRDALADLRCVLEIVKAAGYRELVVVFDEPDTILPRRSDSRLNRSTTYGESRWKALESEAHGEPELVRRRIW
jgi:hypothetical protein